MIAGALRGWTMSGWRHAAFPTAACVAGYFRGDGEDRGLKGSGRQAGDRHRDPPGCREHDSAKNPRVFRALGTSADGYRWVMVLRMPKAELSI